MKIIFKTYNCDETERKLDFRCFPLFIHLKFELKKKKKNFFNMRLRLKTSHDTKFQIITS